MKTAEERAREVIEAAFDTPHNYELRQKNVGSIIRADREALLKRVEFKFRMGIDINDTAARAAMWDALAAVRKEALL